MNNTFYKAVTDSVGDWSVGSSVWDSVDISIRKCFRDSMRNTLTNSTSYAVRFSTQRDTRATILDTWNVGPVLKVSAWAAVANATRDYFKQTNSDIIIV